jgi:NTP pyrophosphatase (non-canonical NTP hydrolase)
MRVLEAQQAAYDLHNRICESKNQTWSPFIALTDILEEAGEVADAVKNLEGYSPHQKRYTPDKLASELSDPLWSVFVIAGMYNVDMESSFKQTLENYEARHLVNKRN